MESQANYMNTEDQKKNATTASETAINIRETLVFAAVPYYLATLSSAGEEEDTPAEFSAADKGEIAEIETIKKVLGYLADENKFSPMTP